MIKQQNIPCAGFIIFTLSAQKVLLVETHRHIFGYPKGKLMKNEGSLIGAYRELQEETGLSMDDIVVIPDKYVDELSFKGNVSTRLYIGFLKNDHDKLYPQDKNEILSASFQLIDDAYSLLIDKRKKVLENAIDIFNDHFTLLIDSE